MLAKLSASYFHGFVSVLFPSPSSMLAKLSASYFHGFVSVQHPISVQHAVSLPRVKREPKREPKHRRCFWEKPWICLKPRPVCGWTRNSYDAHLVRPRESWPIPTHPDPGPVSKRRYMALRSRHKATGDKICWVGQKHHRQTAAVPHGQNVTTSLHIAVMMQYIMKDHVRWCQCIIWSIALICSNMFQGS